MKEITAKQGMYLTQVVVQDEQDRMFITKLTGISVDALQWRDATPEEKLEWEDKYNTETENDLSIEN